MTRTTDAEIGKLRHTGPASEQALAVRAEHDRNLEFFLAHQGELFAKHPKQFLLIHSGGEVVASPDPFELDDLRKTFDDVTRGGALLEVEIPTPMIATPFFR